MFSVLGSLISFVLGSLVDGSFYFGVALGVVGHVTIKALVAKAKAYVGSKV